MNHGRQRTAAKIASSVIPLLRGTCACESMQAAHTLIANATVHQEFEVHRIDTVSAHYAHPQPGGHVRVFLEIHEG
jgi:hypothetical protein